MIKDIKRYWMLYGLFRAIIRSSYFWMALFINIIMYPSWIKLEWWEMPRTILPSMLGFTLGGYAILLAFGDERFRSILTGSQGDGKPSPFLIVNATFVHFIFVQIVAIIFSIILDAETIIDRFHYLCSSSANSIYWCDLLFRFGRGVASFFWQFSFYVRDHVSAGGNICNI